jgi:hypothetical protein
MKALMFRSLGALALGISLLSMLTCARDQQLVSITVQPDTEDFGSADPTLNVQLRALGNYIHPPVTKDITGQVTWVSDTPQVATVTSTGLLSPGGLACGRALISATVQTNHSTGNRSSGGALVTGSMTANVACAGGGGGGGGAPTLFAAFAGLGSGTVASSPPGINCTANCNAPFTSGSNINVTATPAGGFTFGGWSGCDSYSGSSGEICTVNNLVSNRTITVTFN